ncbi:hypothetical protein TcWFU_006180 [Taenia crassiceps]|uniref:Uncharacterized protein n=1 Tax=Taenia crassiceps TaxID=6207 RepID=A0ABR4Q9M9_9CEST
MRSSTLFAFSLLLVLFATASSGLRRSHHRNAFELYYPAEVKNKSEQRQNRSSSSSVDYHKDYLKTLGGQKGDHKVEQELLKNKMKKGKRYN